jgi:hypothetical protein
MGLGGRWLALLMTRMSLGAATGENIFYEQGDLTPHTEPSVSPLTMQRKITKTMGWP